MTKNAQPYIIKLLTLFVILFVTFPVHADMTKARKAMAADDFETAFKEYMENARMGNMFAQTGTALLLTADM